jgi:hypothetical protein
MLSFLLLSKESPLVHVIVNLMVVGFGFGVFSSPNTNAAMSCVSSGDFGVANSIINTMRSVGQVASMAVMTITMHFTIGDALIEEAGVAGIMKTFNTTFIIFAVVCAVGVLFSLNRRKAGREARGPHDAGTEYSPQATLDLGAQRKPDVIQEADREREGTD